MSPGVLHMCVDMCCGQSEYSGTHVFILRDENWGNPVERTPSLSPSDVLDVEGVLMLASSVIYVNDV